MVFKTSYAFQTHILKEAKNSVDKSDKAIVST